MEKSTGDVSYSEDGEEEGICLECTPKNPMEKKKKKNNSNDYLELKSRGKNPSRGSVTWDLSAMV